MSYLRRKAQGTFREHIVSCIHSSGGLAKDLDRHLSNRVNKSVLATLLLPQQAVKVHLLTMENISPYGVMIRSTF